MKKGFTLIELMAVVVIISLVCLLTFPNIVNQIKKSKDANKDNVEKVVISAAKRYVNDNIDKYNEEGDYCISVQALIDNDYLKEDIVNTEDNDITDYSVSLKISNNYNYVLVEECSQMNYIKEGLILYLDGINNTKNGHLDNIDYWEDLSGYNNEINTKNLKFTSNSAVFSRNTKEDGVVVNGIKYTKNMTFEIMYKTNSSGFLIDSRKRKKRQTILKIKKMSMTKRQRQKQINQRVTLFH